MNAISLQGPRGALLCNKQRCSLIYSTKARRDESRYLSVTAVAALKARLAHADIDQGRVLRRFLNTGPAAGTALTAQGLGRILDAAAPKGQVPWPETRLGDYPIRIGAAHDPVRLSRRLDIPRSPTIENP